MKSLPLPILVAAALAFTGCATTSSRWDLAEEWEAVAMSRPRPIWPENFAATTLVPESFSPDFGLELPLASPDAANECSRVAFKDMLRNPGEGAWILPAALPLALLAGDVYGRFAGIPPTRPTSSVRAEGDTTFVINVVYQGLRGEAGINPPLRVWFLVEVRVLRSADRREWGRIRAQWQSAPQRFVEWARADAAPLRAALDAGTAEVFRQLAGQLPSAR